MTQRNDSAREIEQRKRKAMRPRLKRQAIQGGLSQPGRRHDLEDKQQ